MVCEWCIADISSASLSSEQTGYLDLTRSLEQKPTNNPCCNWSVTFFKLVLGFAVGTTLALKWLNCWLRKRNGNRVMTGKLAKVKRSRTVHGWTPRQWLTVKCNFEWAFAPVQEAACLKSCNTLKAAQHAIL